MLVPSYSKGVSRVIVSQPDEVGVTVPSNTISDDVSDSQSVLDEKAVFSTFAIYTLHARFVTPPEIGVLMLKLIEFIVPGIPISAAV